MSQILDPVTRQHIRNAAGGLADEFKGICLVRLRSKGRIGVRSAGSSPGDAINPAAVEAMSEIGVDLSEEFPKPLTDEFVKTSDVVITMGCGDACPIYPGKRYEDWNLEDPAGQDIETVRRIRDEIDARVQKLVAELLRR
jgi:arsenate reductase (thioredoxin)